MEKCLTCQFYDRRNAAPTDGKGPMWGQCRRAAPRLHPLNAKSYMIEGVWPHVRDDDWCGEWKVVPRRVEPRISESLTTPAHAAPARIATLSTGTAPAVAGSPLPAHSRAQAAGD